jgi:hypothetical protein
VKQAPVRAHRGTHHFMNAGKALGRLIELVRC